MTRLKIIRGRNSRQGFLEGFFKILKEEGEETERKKDSESREDATSLFLGLSGLCKNVREEKG